LIGNYNLPMIIFRYLAKEVYGTLLASTAIFLMLLISNQAVRYLTQAAAGVMPLYTVAQIISLQMPLLLPLLLPLGLYIGVLLAYSRLHSDQEMTVLWSCGFSKAQLVSTTLLFSTILAIIIGILTLWFQPVVESYKRQIIVDAASASPLGQVTPDQFLPLRESELVLYTQGLSRDHQHLKDIFVARRSDQVMASGSPAWDIVVAQEGHQIIDATARDRFLVLGDGARYIGMPGEADFQIVQYKNYGVRIQKNALPPDDRVDTRTTYDLWQHQHGNPEFQAELQWRIALPLSALILALLAIPLSKVDSRQGRYAQLLPAFLLYILYVDLLFVSKAWLQKSQIASGVGLWWVHGMMLLITLFLLARFMGWPYRKRPKA
jgi:lipopolysaccharide export system permease protein